MLERPLDNKPADVTFLKENLFYKSNLNELVSDVLSDIEAYEKIVKKDDDVKLVLRLKERPRIYVEYDLMINQTYSFSVLINDLKNQLT